jgi:hypothetical protein
MYQPNFLRKIEILSHHELCFAFDIPSHISVYLPIVSLRSVAYKLNDHLSKYQLGNTMVHVIVIRSIDNLIGVVDGRHSHESRYI